MAQNERPGRTSGEGDVEVPEADAAEQRTSAAEGEGEDDWTAAAPEGADAEAAEGDLVEQLREAGTDDEDEHR